MFQWTKLLQRAVLAKHRSAERHAARRAEERREVAVFCSKVMAPALDDLQAEWERLGRRVSVCRDATIFHVTVWHERMVEFNYSIAACRRKRRQRVGYVHPEATRYKVDVQRVYELSDIRKTDRHKFAKQVAAQYRQRLLSR